MKPSTQSSLEGVGMRSLEEGVGMRSLERLR
jgi:hypothetical protein